MWPILLFVFGVLGGESFLTKYFPTSKSILFVLGPIYWPQPSGISYNVSWAVIISAVIVLLGIGYFTKDSG